MHPTPGKAVRLVILALVATSVPLLQHALAAPGVPGTSRAPGADVQAAGRRSPSSAPWAPAGPGGAPDGQDAPATGPSSAPDGQDAPASGELVSVNIGTLPANKPLTIVFDVTVDSPLVGTATEACNQGTVTATSPAASVVTNDPDTVAADDATCTTLGRPDFTAVKTNSVSGTVAFPNTWDWRIDVANPANHGPGTFTSGQVILRDDLPNTGVSYSSPTVSMQVGISGSGAISCAIATFTLTCTASGGTVTIADPGGFRVTTTATPSTTGTFANPRAGGGCAVDPDGNVVELSDANNGCSDSVTVTAPDLTATKTNNVGGGTTLGNTWDWRVDVANPGNAAATFASGQVILRDDLPNSDVSFASPTVSNQVGLSGTGTVSCAIASFTLTCTASGGTVTLAATTGAFRVTTTATPSATGTFANPRGGGACAVDPDLNVSENNEGNNTCSDSVTVTVPDLTATKTDTVSGATTLGNTWDWRIDVANGDTGPATFASGQVILRDDLPNMNVSYGAPAVSNQVGIGGTGAISCGIATFTLTCTASGGTVTIAGTTGAFRVTTTATPSATGTFANPRGGGVCAVDPDLHVVEASEANNSCTGSVTVTAPDLTANKTDTVSGTTTLGNPWDWRIDVANGGSATATFASGQVILRDDLLNMNVSYGAPAVSNQVGIGGSGAISCGIATFTLTCTASGGTVTIAAAGGFRVTTTATPSANGTFTNPRGGGVCAADPDTSVVESNEANNSCSGSVTVTAPDLTANKTDTVSGATTLGNPWDWRIDVANGGSATATFASGQVILRDDLPNMNISYGTPTLSNQVGIGGSGAISCGIATFTLTCTASGGTVTIAAAGGFRVTTTATPSANGTFTNPRGGGVCAADPDTSVVESNEANNTCTGSVTVTSPDLSATKSDTVAGATLLGNSWDWRIDVANGGNATATFASGQVVLRDDLPDSGIGYSAPTLSNQVGIGGSGTLSCAVASFTLTCTATGGTVTIAVGGGFRVTTTATPTLRGTYANPRSGGVCAVDPDAHLAEPNEADNACTGSVSVTGAELTATKTGPPGGTVAIGEVWEWRIDVANIGDAPAVFPSGSEILRDDLPLGPVITYTGPTLSNQAGLGGPGTLTCTIASDTLTCTAVGGDVTLAGPGGTFRVAVSASASGPGTFTNPRAMALAAPADSPEQAGQCAVDPDSLEPENDNANNNCSDTVIVLEEATAPGLASFTVRATNVGVVVEWETVTEADILGFLIERSTVEQGKWVAVGPLVPARGDAATGMRYSLRDFPEAGIYRYRLKVVDARSGRVARILGPELVRVWTRPAFLPHVAR